MFFYRIEDYRALEYFPNLFVPEVHKWSGRLFCYKSSAFCYQLEINPDPNSFNDNWVSPWEVNMAYYNKWMVVMAAPQVIYHERGILIVTPNPVEGFHQVRIRDEEKARFRNIFSKGVKTGVFSRIVVGKGPIQFYHYK